MAKKKPVAQYLVVTNVSFQGIGETEVLAVKTLLRKQVLSIFLEDIPCAIIIIVKIKNPKTLDKDIQLAIVEGNNFLAQLDGNKFHNEKEEGKNKNNVYL